jgi:hypothetical protein
LAHFGNCRAETLGIADDIPLEVFSVLWAVVPIREISIMLSSANAQAARAT